MDISPGAKKRQRERQLNQVTSNKPAVMGTGRSHLPPTGPSAYKPSRSKRVDIGNTLDVNMSRKARGKKY